MKLKLIPFLFGVVTFSALVIPFRVQAQGADQPQPPSANSTQFPNLTPQQQDNVSRLNLSPSQKAQLQQMKQPVSLQQLESILTPGQRKQLLQNRHSVNGGH